MKPHQAELFEHVVSCYERSGGQAVSNAELYEHVREAAGIPPRQWKATIACGPNGQQHVEIERRVRWYQQDLKLLDLIEHDGKRGVWRLTAVGRRKLTPAQPRRALLAYSTDLGAALWASAEDVFPSLGEPVNLVLTSLPYLLAKPRAYGNPAEDEHGYIDWICQLLEPLVKALAPTGSIVLNVDDTFVPGLPSRRMIPERLALALHDRLGLHKMASLVWHQTSRPPGPVAWASGTHQQLNASYEPLLWYAKDPTLVASDNRRVLQPHTAAHLRLIESGGEPRKTCHADGAHRLRQGSFSNPTAGSIPRDVLPIGQRCADKLRLSAIAHKLGLPIHGATFPVRLAEFLIEFLTERGDLVVDPCAGWFNAPLAAERNGRRWLGTEKMAEYVLGSSYSFEDRPGFERQLLGPWQAHV